MCHLLQSIYDAGSVGKGEIELNTELKVHYLNTGKSGTLSCHFKAHNYFKLDFKNSIQVTVLPILRLLVKCGHGSRSN